MLPSKNINFTESVIKNSKKWNFPGPSNYSMSDEFKVKKSDKKSDLQDKTCGFIEAANW